MTSDRRDFMRGVAGFAALASSPGLAAGAVAAAGSRPQAFVVGIDAYAAVPKLTRAANDARAVTERLDRLGFATTLVVDGDGATIRERFGDFKSGIPGDGAAFLYFAGHGVQLHGTNYLLPRDVDCDSPEAFSRTALSLNELLADLAGLRPGQVVVVIDACRNFLREVDLPGRQAGMTSVSAPGGFYLLYSAGAGEFALESLGDDDPDPNSVFARHFLRSMSAERSIDEIFYEVGPAVRSDAISVPHLQQPAMYNQSGRPLRLVPRPQAAEEPGAGRMDGAAVLLVGVQQYSRLIVPPGEKGEGIAGSMSDLYTPANDTRILARRFASLGAETIVVAEPDRAALADACASLRETGRRELVLYFAGAGGLRGGDGMIIVPGAATDGGSRPLDFVSMRELTAMLLPPRASAAGRTATLIIDSCLNDWGFAIAENAPPALIEDLKRGARDDVAVLYSAAYGEAAADSIDGGAASPCTIALIEALSGACTVGTLSARIRNTVRDLTSGLQNPQMFASPRAQARAFVTAAAVPGSVVAG